MHDQQKSQFSQRSKWATGQQIGYLMQQGVDYPDCLSLAAGLVDPTTLPVQIVQRQMQEILSDPKRARQALQYGTTEGALSFREVLIDYLATLEQCTLSALELTPQRCVVTTGSQQLLDLVSQAIFDPGDICLVTSPTYFVYLSTLQGAGADVRSISCDDQGIIPSSLEAELESIEQAGELHRVKLLYLVSYFDNPRGITMPLKRRLEVLDILTRWSSRQYIYLLEDAAYRELWFDTPPPASMYALDKTKQRVILAQTFSKSLSPGIRTGFGILPDALVKPVTDIKSIHDFGSPHLAQICIENLIRSGDYAEHVAQLRDSYQKKSLAIWRSLEEKILQQAGMTARQPTGGLYVWLQIDSAYPETRFDEEFFGECVENQQLMYVPGELFFANKKCPAALRTMRLSYGVQSEANLQEGIHRLAQGLKAFRK